MIDGRVLSYSESVAEKARGNWKEFDSFAWHDRPDDAEEFCLVHTNSRDSGIREQSNAAIIEKELEKFSDEDVIEQHFGHWAVGWVDGYAIRVYKTLEHKELTKAFLKWCELNTCIEEYPILDESDFSKRQHEAALEMIEWNSRNLKENLPEDWREQVFKWVWDNKQDELDPDEKDEYYFSEECLEEAAKALNFWEDEDED